MWHKNQKGKKKYANAKDMFAVRQKSMTLSQL